MQTDIDKVIIVEGTSDKKKIMPLILEKVEILCTNGTLSTEKLDEWAETYHETDMYILVDADDSGEKLRKRLTREFPFARHIFIDKMYKEVAAAPSDYLASLLMSSDIEVDTAYLSR